MDRLDLTVSRDHLAIVYIEWLLLDEMDTDDTYVIFGSIESTVTGEREPSLAI